MNKIDYYNCRLGDYADFAYPEMNVKSLSSKTYPMKKVLAKLIKSNNEHFLTNSYMYYLILTSLCISEDEENPNFRADIYNSLDELASDNIEKKLRNIMFYIEFIYNSTANYYVYSVDEVNRVEILLDKDHEALLYSFYDSLEKLDEVEISEGEELIITQSLKAVCAYCIVNNRLYDYNELASTILDDIQGFLDRVRVYGSFVNEGFLDTYNLITFVLNYLETQKVLVK